MRQAPASPLAELITAGLLEPQFGGVEFRDGQDNPDTLDYP
jgi:hypothetical protein